jgi:ankyrin repeat protein
MLRALLGAGVDVNCVDYWRRSALRYAACNQEDPKFLEHFIRAGADLNVQDCRERTPLGYAARMGKNRVATYLLSQRADPNISDHRGLSPLFEAIEHNIHDTIRCPLQCGASLAAKTHDGRTILQEAAVHDEILALRILANHDGRGTDLSDDEDGRITQDLFSNQATWKRLTRMHSMLSWEHFSDTLAAIRSVVCSSDVGDTDDDGEEFFDTCEQRDPGTAE